MIAKIKREQIVAKSERRKMMLKLFFGNPAAIISSLLLVANVGYMAWAHLNRSTIQKWGVIILILILLNGILWYFANVRDRYSNSILFATDGSAEMGLFSVGSIQSILYWAASAMIWIAGIVSIFKPRHRRQIFYIIAIASCVQLAFIEGSRIWLYVSLPSSFDYM